MADKMFLRVEDVAEEMGVSVSYAYKLIRKLNKEERMIGASRVADILGISESYAYVVIRELNKDLAEAGYTKHWG